LGISTRYLCSSLLGEPPGKLSEMPTFFHVAPAGLAAGTVLQPGVWGRHIRQWERGGAIFNNHAEAYILLWEVVLEAVRQSIAPDVPSRLDCVFACRSQADAIAFRNRFRSTQKIYSIEVATGIPTFVADYEVIANSIAGPLVDSFVGQALRYWTQKPEGMQEILIGGPAIVR
jgi:Protein of unknown function (DUF2441)